MTGNPLLRSDGIAEIRAVAGRISDVDDHVTVHQAADEIERLRAELVEERHIVLEVAAQIADEFADMFRTAPPFCDNFWAGCNIAKAIRALKDASAPKIGGTLDDTALSPLPAKKGGTVD